AGLRGGGYRADPGTRGALRRRARSSSPPAQHVGTQSTARRSLPMVGTAPGPAWRRSAFVRPGPLVWIRREPDGAWHASRKGFAARISEPQEAPDAANTRAAARRARSAPRTR